MRQESDGLSAGAWRRGRGGRGGQREHGWFSAIAEGLGARVVAVSERGYGAALMGGIVQARGRYVIMGDADDSYDFTNLMPYLQELRSGVDLVMGNRFLGGIKPGAMPPLHRYFGNPVLIAIGRAFFKTPSRDFHCGLLPGTRRIGPVAVDVHTMVYSGLAIVVGFQAIVFAVFTKVFATLEGLLSPDPQLDRLFRYVTLEVGVTVGGIITLVRIAGTGYAVIMWSSRLFGPMDPGTLLRIVVPSGVCLTLGYQIVLSSFFLSILGLKRRRDAPDSNR